MQKFLDIKIVETCVDRDLRFPNMNIFYGHLEEAHHTLMIHILHEYLTVWAFVSLDSQQADFCQNAIPNISQKCPLPMLGIHVGKTKIHPSHQITINSWYESINHSQLPSGKLT